MYTDWDEKQRSVIDTPRGHSSISWITFPSEVLERVAEQVLAPQVAIIMLL